MSGLTAGGIWHETRASVRRHFGVFATVTAVCALLPQIGFRVLAPGLMSGAAMQANPPTLAPGAMGGVFMVILAFNLMVLLGIFAIAAVTADPLEGGDRTFGQTVADAMPGYGKFLLAMLALFVGGIVASIVASIVIGIVITLVAMIVGVASGGLPAGGTSSGIAVLVGFAIFALVFPLEFWVLGRLSPLVGVYIREKTGVFAGIRRAWTMSRGSAWPVIKLMLIYTLLSLCFVIVYLLVVGMPVPGKVPLPSAGIGGMVFTVVAALLGALVSMYWSAATGVIYRQIRESEAA